MKPDYAVNIRRVQHPGFDHMTGSAQHLLCRLENKFDSSAEVFLRFREHPCGT
ncbi:hypothetical protein D3C71_2038940 [compost metagenome]